MAQPASTARASVGLGEVEASAQSTVLPAGRRLATHLPVLVCMLANPVERSILAHHVVPDVHQDDLVVLVGGVLCHPVAVQDT